MWFCSTVITLLHYLCQGKALMFMMHIFCTGFMIAVLSPVQSEASEDPSSSALCSSVVATEISSSSWQEKIERNYDDFWKMKISSCYLLYPAKVYGLRVAPYCSGCIWSASGTDAHYICVSLTGFPDRESMPGLLSPGKIDDTSCAGSSVQCQVQRNASQRDSWSVLGKIKPHSTFLRQLWTSRLILYQVSSLHFAGVT